MISNSSLVIAAILRQYCRNIVEILPLAAILRQYCRNIATSCNIAAILYIVEILPLAAILWQYCRNIATSCNIAAILYIVEILPLVAILQFSEYATSGDKIILQHYFDFAKGYFSTVGNRLCLYNIYHRKFMRLFFYYQASAVPI